MAKDNNSSYFINKSFHREVCQGNRIDHYVDNIFKKFPLDDPLYDIYVSRPNYKEPHFNYSPIPFQPNVILDGYFQSEKYFKNYKAQLNDLFGFVDHIGFEQTTCVIQIRTGDFLTLSDFNVVTPAYFKEAIDTVKSNFGNVTFVVVTDSWSSAERYLPTDNVYQVSQGTELDDLKLMSKADYCIISNSSFGWWGSYLGKDKLTITPDKWLNSLPKEEYEDIYREEMIRIRI